MKIVMTIFMVGILVLSMGLALATNQSSPNNNDTAKYRDARWTCMNGAQFSADDLPNDEADNVRCRTKAKWYEMGEQFCRDQLLTTSAQQPFEIQVSNSCNAEPVEKNAVCCEVLSTSNGQSGFAWTESNGCEGKIVEEHNCANLPIENRVEAGANTYVTLAPGQIAVFKDVNLIVEVEWIKAIDDIAEDAVGLDDGIDANWVARVKVDPYLSAAAIAESQTKIHYLKSGKSIDIGDNELYAKYVSGESTTFTIKRTKAVDAVDADIRVERDMYMLQERELKRIRINPSNDVVDAVANNGEQLQLRVHELSAGIDIPMDAYGKNIKVSSDSDLWNVIHEDAYQARTREIIVSDSEGIALATISGEKRLGVLPSLAAEQARTVTGKMSFEDIQLAEEDGTIFYELKGKQRLKVLGFLPVNGEFITKVDAQSGDILDTDKPWYSFLSVLG